MKINQLSGNSSVKDVKLSNSVIEVLYEDYETDNSYLIKIEAPSFYSEISSEKGGVHVEIEKISDFLLIDENSFIYYFPGEFEKQMRLRGMGFHTAIGLQSTEYHFMFSIMGNQKLVVCPIKDIKDIIIDQINSTNYSGAR